MTPKGRAEQKKKLAVRFSAETEKPDDDSLPGSDTETGEPRRLRFGHEERKEEKPQDRAAVKKKQARRFAADAAKPEQNTMGTDRKKTPAPQESGRLRFEHEDTRTEEPPGNRAKEKKKLAAKFSMEEKRPEGRPACNMTGANCRRKNENTRFPQQTAHQRRITSREYPDSKRNTKQPSTRQKRRGTSWKKHSPSCPPAAVPAYRSSMTARPGR